QAFSEVAPREIRSDVELLLNTYGSLSDALEAIDWDGSAASRDAAVTSTGVRLASAEIQSAPYVFKSSSTSFRISRGATSLKAWRSETTSNIVSRI
ncbi:MAG: hypothetical protein ACKO6O_04465, partial [Acidimicrobiaceae bacterium]